MNFSNMNFEAEPENGRVNLSVAAGYDHAWGSLSAAEALQAARALIAAGCKAHAAEIASDTQGSEFCHTILGCGTGPVDSLRGAS